ncbi:(2Fe-2S)-binding protein [Castellaniella sp. GW247-6E4]|uniref:(2Fe-2S)-binding protein n=1 Tax=Castellaniella sp. GW247-6E4 TaxID=3140380 RepID=UPI0033163D9B
MKPYRSDTPHTVRLTLNGREVSAQATSRMLLSDFLRQVLGATGVHVGCEHGVCGACTVQIDGVAARACLMLAVQAEGRSIETVEGLNRDCAVELTDLQQAFKDHHALQCGFCTAGILMSSDAYLRQVPCPDEAQLRDMLSGHLCRCTGYTNIVQALQAVVARRSGIKEEGVENVRSGS